MEGSDHKTVSSTTPKVLPSASSTDENDQSISSQNSKKSITKHFMSPTISTASKAIAPRKKILAERNEISDTHIQKSPSFNLSDDSLSLNDDSSMKSYDPLTNYPSPRPKFLRYKPNRRKEIVLRHENKVKEEADLASASQEGKEVDKSEEVVEEEEGEEEEEEEKEGFLRRVLKFVLVLLVLVFCTLYISSMNSPTSSPTLQAIEGLKDEWYLKIHDSVYEAMRSLRGGDHFLKAIEFKDIVKIFGGGSKFMDGNVGLTSLNQTFIDEIFRDEEMVDDVYLGKVEEMSDNLSEVAEIQGGEREGFGEMVELQAGESENVEGFDQMLENFELKGTEENVEKLDSFEHNQIATISYAFQQESEVVMEPVQEDNNSVNGYLEMVESEMEKSEHITNIELTDFVTVNSEAESNVKEGLLEHIETDIIFKSVIGVTIFFTAIVSLVMAFNLKKKRNIREESFPIITPKSDESEVMEKCSSVIPDEREEDVKSVYSMSLVDSIVKDSKDLYQSQGPSIELLGEFEVGHTSSSLRSRGMRSRMEESEVSSYSVPLDKEFGNRSKAQSVSGHAHSDFSEFSAMNSLSYGYFTPEKKFSKKEDGRDGEAKKVVITPVRRSSRLRNRAVTSP